MNKIISYFVCSLVLMLAGSSWGEELAELRGTELLNVLVVNRHGYRTPGTSELTYYPKRPFFNSTYYPVGLESLTDSGKRQAYTIGKYLRNRYDGFLDRVYLPEQITVRTTYYPRTKMTALAAMAGLYPPVPAQQWNQELGSKWQPVPITTLPAESDDLLSFANCNAFLVDMAAVTAKSNADVYARYSDLYQLLSEHSGANITSPSDVMALAGAISGQESYGIPRPEWAEKLSSEIEELEGLAFKNWVTTDKEIRLSFGVALSEFLDASALILAGGKAQPRVTMMSTHDANVIVGMAATGVYYQHRPYLGATFSLELRRNTTSGQYGFATVYAARPGWPAKSLVVDGCGGSAFCDYDKFLELTANYTITRDARNAACKT